MEKNLKEILFKIVNNIENNLKDYNLHIELDDKAINYFIDNGYDEAYGARPLKRLVTKELETLIAKKLINNEVNYDDTIKVSIDNDKIILR